MEQKEQSRAEQNALHVDYEVLGKQVVLDIDFVKKYLVRGKAELVTDQELVMFMNTCAMQKLNPLAKGEVYLIKYSESDPAQMVIGKDAYAKRAYLNPNYLGKKDGIIVLRGNDIVRKEGCCLYPTETLIGGWCRVFYERKGKEREAYREVSFDEYNKSKSNWNSKPSTMINKVAISQCLRDAFPSEYEGLYSEEELVASGVIDDAKLNNSNVAVIEEGGDDVIHLDEGERLITQDERKFLFSKAQSLYGKEEGNNRVKQALAELGVGSTTGLKKAQLDAIISDLESGSDSK